MVDLKPSDNPIAYDKALRTAQKVLGEIDARDRFVCIVHDSAAKQVVVGSNFSTVGEMVAFVEGWLAEAKRELAKAAS